jgi:hypothetical protein
MTSNIFLGKVFFLRIQNGKTMEIFYQFFFNVFDILLSFFLLIMKNQDDRKICKARAVKKNYFMKKNRILSPF